MMGDEKSGTGELKKKTLGLGPRRDQKCWLEASNERCPWSRSRWCRLEGQVLKLTDGVVMVTKWRKLRTVKWRKSV